MLIEPFTWIPTTSIYKNGVFDKNDIDFFSISNRLGKVRVNECPAALESSAGARNRRKATVEIQKKIQTQ